MDVTISPTSKVLVKKTFFDVFRRNAAFISGSVCSGHLFDTNTDGLNSFYRLISSVYFSKHCSAFLPISSPKSLFDSLHGQDDIQTHQLLITRIREKMWERVVTEVEIMPNTEALRLHWLRSCWVFKFWSQASVNCMSLPPLSDYGWSIDNDKLECIWDSDVNIKKVEQTVDWYTKGCACKTGCSTNRCKCRKSKSTGKDGFCCPGCKCINCKNVPDTTCSNTSQNIDFSFSDVILETVEADSDDESELEDINDIRSFPADVLQDLYMSLDDTEV